MPKPSSVPEEVYSEVCWEVDARRKETVTALETAWDAADAEPLLHALRDACARKERAEEEIRLLVAYGREFTRPRPYTLADLAEAAGMSISGVRTAYDHEQVAAVADAIGRLSRDWRAKDRTDPPETTEPKTRPGDGADVNTPAAPSADGSAPAGASVAGASPGRLGCRCPAPFAELAAYIDGQEYAVHPADCRGGLDSLYRAYCRTCGAEFPGWWRVATPPARHVPTWPQPPAVQERLC